MTILGLAIFGAIGYVIGDQWLGMGWLGLIVGCVIVLGVAFLDSLENN